MIHTKNSSGLNPKENVVQHPVSHTVAKPDVLEKPGKQGMEA